MTQGVGAEPQVILLRYSGEISTKARATRSQFTSRLLRNVRDALARAGVPAEVERAHERILVETGEPAALDALARVFGVQSASRAERREATSLEALVEAGAGIFREAVQGRRYAVRARLVGSPGDLPYRARDVERALGAALAPGAGRVDLEQPELTARVEVYRGRVYYCLETRSAEGGLPVGSEGRALALVSGGFDSAVAAWHLLKRGVRLDYLFCNLGGRTHELGVLRVMKVVAERWSHGYRPLLHAVDFGPVVREIQAHAQPRYWQVLLKRYMLRVGEAIARERHAEALATGEALGQVSSQTLTNLASISEAVSIPILRPLVGFNKDEIIERARHVGTAELSAVVGEYCALVPHHPATAARVEVLRDEEMDIDPGVVTKVLGEREELDLRAVDPEERGPPEIQVDAVPDGATLVDLRNRAEFDSWHPEGAVQLDFAQALRGYPSFAKDQRYVLYCEFGLKSAHLAELMHREGFTAQHFRGGTRALRRWVEDRR